MVSRGNYRKSKSLLRELPNPCEVPKTPEQLLQLRSSLMKVLQEVLSGLGREITIVDVEVMFPLGKTCPAVHRCHYVAWLGLWDGFDVRIDGCVALKGIKDMFHTSRCELAIREGQWLIAVQLHP